MIVPKNGGLFIGEKVGIKCDPHLTVWDNNKAFGIIPYRVIGNSYITTDYRVKHLGSYLIDEISLSVRVSFDILNHTSEVLIEL